MPCLAVAAARDVGVLAVRRGRAGRDPRAVLMAHVHLNGNLRMVAGGQSTFDIDARNVRGVLKGLIALHPALEPHLAEGIAVAIDGEIYQDAWFADVAPDSEVHIMPAIGGG